MVISACWVSMIFRVRVFASEFWPSRSSRWAMVMAPGVVVDHHLQGHAVEHGPVGLPELLDLPWVCGVGLLRLTRSLERIPVPTVFAAHGLTPTASFELALPCDP